MRILVCGGRDYDNWEVLDNTLWKFWWSRDSLADPLVIITGDAVGADWLARAWAKMLLDDHVIYEGYPADWKTHGKAAGAIRNQEMLDKGRPDLVVAFPGGKGTADMVARARKAGVPVREID